MTGRGLTVSCCVWATVVTAGPAIAEPVAARYACFRHSSRERATVSFRLLVECPTPRFILAAGRSEQPSLWSYAIECSRPDSEKRVIFHKAAVADSTPMPEYVNDDAYLIVTADLRQYETQVAGIQSNGTVNCTILFPLVIYGGDAKKFVSQEVVRSAPFVLQLANGHIVDSRNGDTPPATESTGGLSPYHVFMDPSKLLDDALMSGAWTNEATTVRCIQGAHSKNSTTTVH